MSNDIRNLLLKLNELEEGAITPVKLTDRLNPQQQEVPQLPALFKPKGISVLGAKKDPKHPMKGYAVGGGAAESATPAKNALEEAMQEVEEDMLSKVKRGFVDYLEKLEKNDKIDSRLVDRAKEELDIADEADDNKAQQPEPRPVAGKPDPWANVDPRVDRPVIPGTDRRAKTGVFPTLPKVGKLAKPIDESPVKTYAMEDGSVLECYGDDDGGFELRRGGRVLPTRFKNVNDADMAVKLWQRRRKPEAASTSGSSQDYIEEK